MYIVVGLFVSRTLPQEGLRGANVINRRKIRVCLHNTDRHALHFLK